MEFTYTAETLGITHTKYAELIPCDGSKDPNTIMHDFTLLYANINGSKTEECVQVFSHGVFIYTLGNITVDDTVRRVIHDACKQCVEAHFFFSRGYTLEAFRKRRMSLLPEL